jgi:hypothetical protein
VNTPSEHELETDDEVTLTLEQVDTMLVTLHERLEQAKREGLRVASAPWHEVLLACKLAQHLQKILHCIVDGCSGFTLAGADFERIADVPPEEMS